jgi:hypothetical protein
MAPGEGRREVPDSEDEPMTSSPVNVSDGAADKLCATAPVALQDTQDALQEAARPHQATTENTANLAGGRIRSLSADQENASLDTVAFRVEATDILADVATAPQGAVNMTPMRDVTAHGRTQKEQTATYHELTNKLVTTTAAKTDLTMRAPEVGLSNAGVLPAIPTHETVLDQPEQHASSETRHQTSRVANSGEKLSGPERQVANSANSGRAVLGEEDGASSTELSASQEVSGQTVGSRDGSATGSKHITEAEEVVPTMTYYVAGNLGSHQIFTDKASQAQVEGSSSILDAKHAVGARLIRHVSHLLTSCQATIHQDLSRDAHGYTGTADLVLSDLNDHKTECRTLENETSSGHPQADPHYDSSTAASVHSGEFKGQQLLRDTEHDVSDTRVDRNTPTGIHFSPRDLQSRPVFIDVKLETGTPNVTMNDDTSHSIPPTEAQIMRKNDTNSSNCSTNDITDTSTATSTRKAKSQDTNNLPTSTLNATITTRSNEESELASQPLTTPTALSSNSQSATLAQPTTTDDGPVIGKTPQEVTLAELKAQKSAMLASLAALPAIQVLMEENASSDAEICDGDDEPTETDIMAAANKIVKDHIKLLHEYNELKDVGQGLMGLIADQRGVRIIEVQEEFGIDAQD